MKIKKNDNIIVTAGKDKGKEGKVESVIPEKERVVVAGVNVRKVHEKARGRNGKGQIVEKNMPIHISNVMLKDPKSGKPSRIGYEVKDGKKTRIAKKSGQKIQ